MGTLTQWPLAQAVGDCRGARTVDIAVLDDANGAFAASRKSNGGASHNEGEFFHGFLTYRDRYCGL